MIKSSVKNFLILCISLNIVNASEFYYKNGKKIFLNPVSSPVLFYRNISNVKYYETPNKKVVGIDDKIVIKVKKNTDLDQLSLKYNITIIKKIFNENYLVRITQGDDALDISNKLYMNNNVIYAHPSFIRKIDKR